MDYTTLLHEVYNYMFFMHFMLDFNTKGNEIKLPSTTPLTIATSSKLSIATPTSKDISRKCENRKPITTPFSEHDNKKMWELAQLSQR